MKVSIITVTYNSAATLTRALRSVQRQTYSNIEHIIVDGESADATLPIIRDYAAGNSNVRYISEPDQGIYDAINKGIRMATGDIIGILNSDDCLADQDVISTIVKTFQETSADITYGDLVYCRYTDIDRELHVVRNWISNPFHSHDLSLGWMPPHPTLYCKKSVYEEVGKYKLGLKISADYDFILRAFSQEKYKKVYIPKNLINMSMGGVSNRNLRSIIRKTKEDCLVMKQNNMPVLCTVLCKNLRKVGQFFH